MLPAGAAITVVGTTTSFQASDAPINGNFNAFGADKIVVIATGEHGNPNTLSNGITDVTFNGISFTRAVDRNSITVSESPLVVDQTWNDIWYLDASDYTGGTFPNLSLQISGVNPTTRGIITVFGLAGTANGVGNTVIGSRDSNTASLTTSAGSIVIASYGMGGNGNTAILAGTSYESGTQLSAVVQGTNWNAHVTGYTNDVAAGNASYSFVDETPTGAHVIAAEFLIPEPSSALLGGLGLLVILRRRR
jgi:hypothetical protein